MELKYGGFNSAYYTPFTSSSSNYTKFSDQAPEERLWSGGGRPESLRELEKRIIREEIIAEEVERRRILESEVRRELMVEQEMMAVHNRFTLGAPYSNHNRSLPGVLHGEIGGLEVMRFHRRPQSPTIREITTSRPKVDEKGVIGLGQPFYGPAISGAKRKPPSQAAGGTTELPNNSKKKKDDWSCALCEVNMTSERSLQEHIGGKKHQAKVSVMRDNQAGNSEKSGSKLKSVQMDSREVGASIKKIMSKRKKGKKHLKKRIRISR